ncbi:MAG: glycosyl hydrolase family 5 [Isosphaeraceae bacterium]
MKRDIASWLSWFVACVLLGGTYAWCSPIRDETYPEPDRSWFRQALLWDSSPVNLSYLNASDRPAGRHGKVKSRGDALVFEDGTPARFWGANLSGPVLFHTPREYIPLQARRMAALGYNLARIVQHEASWVNPNIFGSQSQDTRHLDPRSLDLLDYWVKCLEDEGIYVWLDMHYLRPILPGDGVTLGRDEIAREKSYWGFNYVNPQLQALMKEFQRQYLGHVNRYTRTAYKDDPAVIGVLITNENDLTVHFGLRFLPDKHNPVHLKLFQKKMNAFVAATGMPANLVWRTWEPGPSKYWLCDLEHQFNRMMIDELRTLGVQAPIATTNQWGPCALCSLPPLTDGDVIDVHCYGGEEALSANPRSMNTFPSPAATAQVYGKPLVITEWNMPFPAKDRFTAPLYIASIASLQGWDAPMIYNYSQLGIHPPGDGEATRRIDTWSTYLDPAITGVMPAAAVAFRRGHISPARKAYCLKLTPEQLLGTSINPGNAATIRTLVEQSKLSIGMPAIKELPWLKPSEPAGDVTIVTDPNHDFIPAGATSVRSDTGEIVRSWKEGIQVIDTPRTQALSGWIGGKSIKLKDATFAFNTVKALVALTSIDDEPLSRSRFILITAIGQARPSPANHLPFLTEPVIGTITLRTQASGLELLSLGSSGKVVSRTTPSSDHDGLSISLPSGRGTHWYVLKGSGTGKKTTAAN